LLYFYKYHIIKLILKAIGLLTLASFNINPKTPSAFPQ